MKKQFNLTSTIIILAKNKREADKRLQEAQDEPDNDLAWESFMGGLPIDTGEGILQAEVKLTAI